jgi:subfamily B ATP-binding cassette protein MsbA
LSQKSQFIDHFRFLNKEARLWVWVVLVLSLVGTALDAVGIGLFYPVITGKSIQEIFSNGWLKELLNFMESSGLSLSSKNLVMIVIVIFAVRALFKYLEHVLNEYIKVRATKNLRLEMADLLERMNGPLVLSLKSGEQLTLALNETIKYCNP